MLIFIEGVDGSGKSTLINKLCDGDLIDAKVDVKRSCRNFTEYYRELSRLKGNIIFDRCFISELIYRIEDGKKTTLNLMDILNSVQGLCKIVYCSNRRAYENAILRGEDNITDPDRHELISNAYDLFMNIIEKFTNIPICRYDFEFDDVSSVINFIKGGER